MQAIVRWRQQTEESVDFKQTRLKYFFGKKYVDHDLRASEAAFNRWSGEAKAVEEDGFSIAMYSSSSRPPLYSLSIKLTLSRKMFDSQPDFVVSLLRMIDSVIH